MANKYGLTTTSNVAKTARTTVSRWNDGTRRHTVYTVCGTTQDGWGLYNDPGTNEGRLFLLNLMRQVTGNNSLTLANLPADGTHSPLFGTDQEVGRRANPALFNWVPISYPAAAPGQQATLENNWDTSKFSMADSMKFGVEELTRHIRATPGTFAIVGMSQGAAVISQVLKSLLPGGALSSRYNDCIAGIALGNPCRAPGAAFPGGVPAPGSGIVSLGNKNRPMASGLVGVKTPDWWWEFTVPGDFFSSAPMNTALGPLLSPAILALLHTPGSLSVQGAGVQVLVALLLSGGALAATLFASLVRGGVLAGANQLNNFFGGAEMKTFLSNVAQRQTDSAIAQLQQWIYQQVGAINVQASIAAGAPVIVPSNYYPRGNPHLLLGVEKPPALPSGQIKAYGPNPAWTINLSGLNSNSTYIDVAAAYLNARGAAVAPR